MKGQMFKTYTEQIKREQFKDKLTVLKVYSYTHFKQNINFLTSFFSQLREPVVLKSPDPVETTVNDVKGQITKPTTKFDKIAFQEKVEK